MKKRIERTYSNMYILDRWLVGLHSSWGVNDRPVKVTRGHRYRDYKRSVLAKQKQDEKKENNN